MRALSLTLGAVLLISLAGYLATGAARLVRDRRQGLPDNLFKSSIPEKVFGWIFVAADVASILI